VTPTPPGAEAPALRVVGLARRYGAVRALDGVDLSLGPQETVALVGPSGCGKSTLLRLVAGLERADSGRVVLAGQVVDDGRGHLPPERRRVGLVFQDHSLFPHLTVEGNVGFGVRHVDATERARRVAEVLDLVDLRGLGRRYPHELSGGQRQRVAVARALAPRPALVLFDEPFASLDQNLRIQVREEVRAVLRRTGTPAVFVTHDQQEAMELGDRVGVMREGRLVQAGRPEAVYHRPVDRFVGAFLGEASFLAIDVGVTGTLRTALGPVDRVTAAVGRPVVPGRDVAMIRPDDVTFVPDPGGDAEVVTASYRGPRWVYAIVMDSGPRILAEQSHLAPLAVGMRGRVSLTAGHRQVPIAGT
jgi:iron(III) transport system ATP-binding protein